MLLIGIIVYVYLPFVVVRAFVRAWERRQADVVTSRTWMLGVVLVGILASWYLWPVIWPDRLAAVQAPASDQGWIIEIK